MTEKTITPKTVDQLSKEEVADDRKVEPWCCPSCRSEDVKVRNVQLPGGPPGHVLRCEHVQYDARCMICGTIWIAFYVADRIEIQSGIKEYPT